MSEDLSIGELDELWFINKCSADKVEEPSDIRLGVFLEVLCKVRNEIPDLHLSRIEAFSRTLKT